MAERAEHIKKMEEKAKDEATSAGRLKVEL
jgi:hypothetical protein